MGSTRTAIGIDVGGTGTKGALVRASGEIVGRVERPTLASGGTKGAVAAAEELLNKAVELGIEVDAVGIGAAGFVDAKSGTVTFAPNVTYDDPHIAEAVQAHTSLPTLVDNDANAACWGERAFGSARGSDYVSYLGMGTGIGSGFIEAGRLVRGFTGAGAEMGHTVIEILGPPCNCGLRGCLEQYASGQAIARMAREALADNPDSSILDFAGSIEEVSARDVARAAHEYDDTARSVLRRAGRALGIGLSNIANVFDPEVIVLGGGVVQSGEPFLGPARDEIARMSDAQRRRPLRIVLASLGGDAGIVGAAALALTEAPGRGSQSESEGSPAQ
jgi:glucokinase